MEEHNRKHFTIAVMTGDTQSEYSEDMLRGFFVSAEEEGVNIVLLMGPQIPTYCTDIVTNSITGNYRYQFDSIYQYTHLIKPDAAVITYGSLAAFNKKVDKQQFLKQFSDIPCLMIEDDSMNENVPSLTSDNYGGMKACVEHLLDDHGLRKIVFLGGPEGNFDAEERKRAYCDAMREHQIPVTETMIIHGDYTEHVDEQVLYLLDNNPDLEAIVCANDGMTKACYRICAMRNMIVGKDVAITGFDDIAPCLTMNPPLTSVSQSIFRVSYHALKKAVAMCRGEKVVSEHLPTILKKRCSCGCTPVKALKARYIPQDEMEEFIRTSVEEIAPYLFSAVSYDKDYKELKEAFFAYFDYIYTTVFHGGAGTFNMDHLMEILKKMTYYPYLSNEALVKQILEFLQILLANAPDGESQRLVAFIMESTQQYIHSFNVERLQKEIYISDRKSWFVPTFTKDLASEAYMNNPEGIFMRVMGELQKMAVRRAYFFLFDRPVTHVPGKQLNFSSCLRLVAYFNQKEMKFYHQVEQPVITRQEGISSIVDAEDSACLTSMILFSESKQYGMMVCDVDKEDIAFLQICSVQLGTLLNFIELHQLEQQAQRGLENSLRVIQEQNRILGFLSEYDELTNLLNRRGFIEKALNLYEKSEGKNACLIFGDLDHLKEINDVFGHGEGDFAIRTAADRLTAVLPDGALIGRIGGDEYVAFLIPEEEDFSARIQHDFAEAGRTFNDKSDKPYYVDISIGVYEFVCDPAEDFGKMLEQSDHLLYQAKLSRRTTICKEP